MRPSPAPPSGCHSLPQAEYIDLLAALAAENGSGDEELLLSAKDREAVGPAVVKAANARKAGAAFRLSEETRETGGGLVLRRGRVELNCSFTEKLRQLRQEECLRRGQAAVWTERGASL